LGRTTTVPAVDAPGLGSKASITGNLTLGYYSNDMVASQAQGGATRTFTLDPTQNRIASTSDGTNTTINTYSSNSDSPTFSTTAPTSVPAQTTANTTWTRNITGIDGALVGIQTNTGVVTFQLANLHGDIIATVNDDTTATAPAKTNEATEYGVPRNATATPDTYGWLGAAQRSTDVLGGLTLMGVRLYNPTTGRFLSTDPIPGGGANSYSYPTDPVNMSDASGKCWWGWKCARQAAASLVGSKIINLVLSFASPIFCTAIGWGPICTAIVGGLAGAVNELIHQWVVGNGINWYGVIVAGIFGGLSAAGLRSFGLKYNGWIRGQVWSTVNRALFITD